MSMYITLIATSLLALTATFATEPTPRTSEDVERVFEALDRNHDERISREEAQQHASLRERFRGVDASGDGYLSKEEFRARPSDEQFE